jgi:hypothetical protein
LQEAELYLRALDRMLLGAQVPQPPMFLKDTRKKVLERNDHCM